MIEQFFERILSIKELSVTQVEEASDKYIIYVESQLKQGICQHCGSKCEQVNQYYQRSVRDLPIIGKEVHLIIEVRQFECKNCGRYFSESFSFVRPNQNLTIRFEDYLYDRCKGVELKYIARKEGLDWDTVDNLFQRRSKSEIEHRGDWDKVTHMAIDEIALKKGHKNYVAVILDLQNGVILDILESRDKAFLIKYFGGKGDAFCNQIEVFSSDMWEGYLNCAKEVFPNARIVADRFHFFSKCQDGLDTCRKYFRRKYKEDEVLKNAKWPLLKNPENLSDKDTQKLHEIFEKKDYELIKLTYEARNDFRNILEKDINYGEAEELINEWMDRQCKEIKNPFFISIYHFLRKMEKVHPQLF